METIRKPNLFWDIDSNAMDPVKYANFIIQRILDRGDVDDFGWAMDFYGKDQVEKIFQKSADKLSSKSNNFWCFYFNLDKAKCTQKQSIKKQSPFWQR
jgi:hypothetical protein